MIAKITIDDLSKYHHKDEYKVVRALIEKGFKHTGIIAPVLIGTITKETNIETGEMKFAQVRTNHEEPNVKWQAVFTSPQPDQSAYIERLEKALIIYGRHRNDGEVFCEKLKHGDYHCTCGFEDLLASKENKE